MFEKGGLINVNFPAKQANRLIHDTLRWSCPNIICCRH